MKHQPRYLPATVLDQLNSHLWDLKAAMEAQNTYPPGVRDADQRVAAASS